MGTIDISYLSLGIGLLLLSIPLFYIWKFKTGLLRAPWAHAETAIRSRPRRRPG